MYLTKILTWNWLIMSHDQLLNWNFDRVELFLFIFLLSFEDKYTIMSITQMKLLDSNENKCTMCPESFNSNKWIKRSKLCVPTPVIKIYG